jgi:hypothetical protein
MGSLAWQLSQCSDNYKGTALAPYLRGVQSGIQKIVIPTTGLYLIQAEGAHGTQRGPAARRVGVRSPTGERGFGWARCRGRWGPAAHQHQQLPHLYRRTRCDGMGCAPPGERHRLECCGWPIRRPSLDQRGRLVVRCSRGCAPKESVAQRHRGPALCMQGRGGWRTFGLGCPFRPLLSNLAAILALARVGRLSGRKAKRCR